VDERNFAGPLYLSPLASKRSFCPALERTIIGKPKFCAYLVAEDLALLQPGNHMLPPLTVDIHPRSAAFLTTKEAAQTPWIKGEFGRDLLQRQPSLPTGLDRVDSLY